MSQEDPHASAVSAFVKNKHDIEIFMDGVNKWFYGHPELRQAEFPIIHSVKSRLKNEEHLREKLVRKSGSTETIDENNIFEKITDLAGVRVLHLYQDQFKEIHQAILYKVNNLKDWYMPELPKAYTWDPESKIFFEGLGVNVEVKESFYTSVHYLVKPRQDSPICCEIQVRTLFEEIWGEIDHSLNYPVKTENLSCREQLLVLAKLVGAGSRLADSIFRSINEDKGAA